MVFWLRDGESYLERREDWLLNKRQAEIGLSLPHLPGIIPLWLDHSINSCY